MSLSYGMTSRIAALVAPFLAQLGGCGNVLRSQKPLVLRGMPKTRFLPYHWKPTSPDMAPEWDALA